MVDSCLCPVYVQEDGFLSSLVSSLIFSPSPVFSFHFSLFFLPFISSLFSSSASGGNRGGPNPLCCGYTCTISKPSSEHHVTCLKGDGLLVWFLSLSLPGSGY